MLVDRKPVWMAEYVIGIGLLASVMPFIAHPQPGWSEAHGWAYLLFIACAGFTLLSSASAMRQRMRLAKRIAKLEEMTKGLKRSGNQVNSENIQKRAAKEQFVSSVN